MWFHKLACDHFFSVIFYHFLNYLTPIWAVSRHCFSNYSNAWFNFCGMNFTILRYCFHSIFLFCRSSSRSHCMHSLLKLPKQLIVYTSRTSQRSCWCTEQSSKCLLGLNLILLLCKTCGAILLFCTPTGPVWSRECKPRIWHRDRWAE